MSNRSAEHPQTAIRRMVSTVETIQSLFPDLWVSADSDSQEKLRNGDTGRDTLDSTRNCDQQPYTAVPIKESSHIDGLLPCTRMKNRTPPESSSGAMSRIMSTVAVNQLLFPELWDPIDEISQDVLPDRSQVAYGPSSTWTRNQQQHIQLPVKQQDIPKSVVSLELVDRSKDEESNDSGIYSETNLA